MYFNRKKINLNKKCELSHCVRHTVLYFTHCHLLRIRLCVVHKARYIIFWSKKHFKISLVQYSTCKFVFYNFPLLMINELLYHCVNHSKITIKRNKTTHWTRNTLALIPAKMVFDSDHAAKHATSHRPRENVLRFLFFFLVEIS